MTAALQLPAPLLPAPSAASTLRLKFLGGERAVLDGAPVKLRRRFCEILVILATHPSGMSGGQLCSALYGDWVETQNQAVEVHRLSKLVAIQRKPYRVVPGVSADLLDVSALLAEGRVLEAVQLYRGSCCRTRTRRS
ncbi:helix-turn-helix domain-containing protein [Deinococcus maricopensis]|uniref:helix-turn-helix domain-containing protein n=1 Tax=Deinococcus maricopensis TaxID=309887 RepID=UPI0002EBD7CB|nr:helix-turn-helix domain-containing protein [Deinococcus maricopensis]